MFFRLRRRSKKPPFLLKWRSASIFIQSVVSVGLLTDMAIYGLIVPVVPFRLRDLHYHNVASLTGWLIAAYAGGLVGSSPPAAVLGELWKDRQIPLLGALCLMIGAIVLFMEAHSYTLLVIARVLQGCSGTLIWTVGMALVVDSVEEANVAQSLGNVMTGFSIGSLIGSPIGGILYQHGGFRAPFYFALALVGLDLILRLSIIEHHVAFQWIVPQGRKPKPTPYEEKENELSIEDTPRKPSRMRAMARFFKNPRVLACLWLTVVNGTAYSGLLDASMTLYLNARYGLSSQGAGVVFLGSVAPSFFSSPLAGWLVTRVGARKLSLVCISVAVVPFGLLIIRQIPLGVFVVLLVFLGLASSAALVPIMTDLTMMTYEIEGLGPANCFACFNFCFSIGALIGPIIGGQVLNAMGDLKGWQVMSGLSGILYASAVPGIYFYMSGKHEQTSQ